VTLTMATSGGLRGNPRWLWMALIGSLAVNLLVAGIIVTAWWRGPGPMAGNGVNQRVFGFLRTLPAARGRELRQGLDIKRPELRANVQAFQQARRQAVQAIGTEPFDRKAVETSLDGLDEREFALRRFNRPLIIDIMQHLTPQERQQLVRGLRGPGGKGGDHPRRDEGRTPNQ